MAGVALGWGILPPPFFFFWYNLFSFPPQIVIDENATGAEFMEKVRASKIRVVQGTGPVYIFSLALSLMVLWMVVTLLKEYSVR